MLWQEEPGRQEPLTGHPREPPPPGAWLLLRLCPVDHSHLSPTSGSLLLVSHVAFFLGFTSEQAEHILLSIAAQGAHSARLLET